MRAIFNKMCLVSSVILLSACGSGGAGGDGPTSAEPYPYPKPGNYNGTPYTQLGQPAGFTASYPQQFLPNNLPQYGLQMAFGNNSEAALIDLVAYIQVSNIPYPYPPSNMVNDICSATPIYYDNIHDRTWFVSAAHCFTKQKQFANRVVESDIWSRSQPISIMSGKYGNRAESSNVTVFLPKDYCLGSSFAASSSSSYGGSCPHFTPDDGGQGNDIALFYIGGYFRHNTDNSRLPKIAPPESYPDTYTMAPVLSLGYGINTQAPNYDAKCSTSTEPCGTMFAVVNYQYGVSNNTGYHYLYNSYYNSGAFGSSGYTSLVCGGDSGGPDLFWTGSEWILLSEHSYGPVVDGNGVCGGFFDYLPNGATNVSVYYSWLQSIIYSDHSYTTPRANPVLDCKANANGVTNCVTNG